MSEGEFARLETQIQAIDRTLRDFCLSVTARLATGDEKIANNRKDIDGLATLHRKDCEILDNRIGLQGKLIIGGFTVMSVLIVIFKFI